MNKAGLISGTILGFALVASLCSASYTPTDFSTELSSSDVSKAKSYVQYLDEINAALRSKLPNNKDPQANMEIVKELSKSVSKVVHMGKAKALKLIASLEAASYECNHKSFRILAKNMVALEAMENKLEKPETRLRAIFDHYHKGHAFQCDTQYRQAFHKNVAYVTDKNMRRIEAAFDDMTSSKFMRHSNEPNTIPGKVPAYWLPDTSKKMLLRADVGLLSEKPYPEATREIAENIVKMVKENSEDWALYGPYVDKKSAQRSVSGASKMFDEYLFKPCAEYEKFLGEDLSAARLDALVEEEGKDFLGDRPSMYKGLMYSKLCKIVLKDQSKLQKVLAELAH